MSDPLRSTVPTCRRAGPPLARLLAASFVALLACAARLDAQPVYHATYLGPGSHVTGLNDAGTVVYRRTVGVYPRAYVSQDGQPGSVLLMPFGLLSSTPKDINEAGAIVGDVSPFSSTSVKAFPAAWYPDGSGGYGTAAVLALLPGDDRGTADTINDHDEILGTSSFTSSTHTVWFSDAGTQDLPGLAGLPPYDLNDQRVYVTSGGRVVHFDTQLVESLPVPAGHASVDGWVINDGGQVAGDAVQAAGCSAAGVHTPGQGWELLSACGAGNACRDLNDAGDALLDVDGVPYVSFAAGGVHRLEDLIADDAGHWTPTSATGIALNDNGQLAIVATNTTTGQTGVVLLTPEDTTCQADLGQAGPGSVQISLCGGDLSSGTSADFVLTGGVPGGTAWLVLGLTESAVPFKGGALVPVPWLLLQPLPLDVSGGLSLPGLGGGGGPLSVFLQVVVPDAAQLLGFAVSNSLRADFLP